VTILSAWKPAPWWLPSKATCAALTRIPGIGKKTAERMVLELRVKLDAFGIAAAVARYVAGGRGLSPALVNLGYQRPIAERAWRGWNAPLASPLMDSPQSHAVLGQVALIKKNSVRSKPSHKTLSPYRPAGGYTGLNMHF